ncbi:hypothetical protein [Mycoplasma feriruminatoris]|uniref:Lipoprotein n=1 Tax=Mycoplasma feriruminatoris TaxID=1179777 RepID=A0AAX3TGQ4_9MOLU|nr:hypothetical protein [Mycoplasma feriruminatoris]WFQ92812.1 hypothetical protein MFERI14822_00604 [Mycoplasma feriruminatoris]WFQ96147.1 lipoprotein [Mycoplasma feriruminatoris]
MKNLITLLGIISLIIASGFITIACKTPNQPNANSNNTIPKRTNEMKKEIKEEKEKNSKTIKKDEDKNKEKKQVEKTDNKQEELLQNDQPEKIETYMFKRNKKTNFDLIRTYGEKIWSFFYSRPEKLFKLNEDHSSNPLATLARTITTHYQKIVKYRDQADFETKEKTKLDVENLFKEFDKDITKYEEEKDNIWKLINSL